jgi:hypothetical protein
MWRQDEGRGIVTDRLGGVDRHQVAGQRDAHLVHGAREKSIELYPVDTTV